MSTLEMHTPASQPDTIQLDRSQSGQSGAQSHLPASRNPIDTLPVEVVSIVFFHYTHSVSWPKTSPLTLGKICRQWRQIAWSTPNLWTRLSISSHHAKSEIHIELAEEWLNRSGHLLLEVQYFTAYEDVRHQNDCREDILAVRRRMFNVLSRHSDRWGSLSLNLPSQTIKELGTLSRPTSKLRHLSLQAKHGDRNDIRLDPDYPRIQTFATCSPKIVDLTSVHVALNWAFVTQLYIDTMNLDEVLYIFQEAHSLSSCEFEGIGTYAVDLSALARHSRNRIICQCLESLEIIFADDTAQVFLCRSILAPALRHLRIGVYDTDIMDFSMDDLVLLLAHSRCSLESLVIYESEFEKGSLIRLAPLLTSLKDLEILGGYSPPDDGHNNQDTFYHLLANPSQLSTQLLPSIAFEGPFLPSLESFEWEGQGPYLWDTLPGLLQPVARNGIQHRRPLRLVTIQCHKDTETIVPYIPTDVLQELLKFDEVEFDFMVGSYEDSPVDWWEASLERMDKGEDMSESLASHDVDDI